MDVSWEASGQPALWVDLELLIESMNSKSNHRIGFALAISKTSFKITVLAHNFIFTTFFNALLAFLEALDFQHIAKPHDLVHCRQEHKNNNNLVTHHDLHCAQLAKDTMLCLSFC